MTIEIALQDGRTVKHCEALVLTFCERDFSYRNYDLAPVPEDNVLTLDQVRLANRIIARMPLRVAESLSHDSERISQALSRVPPVVDLEDKASDIPWSAIENLFAVCLRPGARTASVTKVLHKKRPRLIPILDSVVAGYLSRVGGLRNPDQANEAWWAVQLVRVAKRDIDNNGEGFRILQRNLAGKGYLFSIVRLYDILFWAWSGEYSPTWQDTPVSTASRPANRSGGKRPMPEFVKEMIRQANIKYWRRPEARERMRKIQLQRRGKR